MYDVLVMEISHRLKQLVDYKARIGLANGSSFMFDVRDKVSACDEIFNDIADGSAI